MKQYTLTASANVGIGLWTSICVGFCSIFGRESNHYKEKQDCILAIANKRLKAKLEKLGSNYTLVDYRVTWSKPLSVTVSGLATQETYKCPECGADVTYEMTFCGECGHKLR